MIVFDQDQGLVVQGVHGATIEGETEPSATVVQTEEHAVGPSHPDIWGTVSSVSGMLAAMAALVSIWQARRIHKAARDERDRCRSSDLYKQHVLDPLTTELKSFLDTAHDLFANARTNADNLDGNSTVDDLSHIQREASNAFAKANSAAWRRIVLHLDSWDAPGLAPEIRGLWERMDDAVCNEFDKVQLPTDEMGNHVLSGITAILRAVLHHDPARPDICG